MAAMSYPDEQDFIEILGVVPEVLTGEVGVTRVVLKTGEDEILSLVIDVVSCSVRLKWVKAGSVLLDMYREFVSQVTLDKAGQFIVKSVGAEFTSELTVATHPVGARESLLSD
ncbi:hypothetical protein [Nocardia ignorata]|uniref:Uncharacterized protein n=1 Tax=Nocardia ignorata TaxID=145285 RepID=A0A4R6NYL3_NOCIG|nr:hypothetical protein [Nocardia ignorata]TDP27614.1 hypothetical protein DFR75_1235 [Nocardia ignorata]